MSGAPKRREKEKLLATDFHATFSWCRRALALLQVHVEEPVARVARHVIVHEEELLVVVRREVAHGLLQLRDAADETLLMRPSPRVLLSALLHACAPAA